MLKGIQGMRSKTPNQSRIQNKRKQFKHTLPTIPDKRYFAIGEVADLCMVMPHVLRYWETEFSQLKPMKRRGNRRYYQQSDILMVRQIRKLLYEDGFTIEGARSQLRSIPPETDKSNKTESEVKKIIVDLERILQQLKTQEHNGA